MAISWCLAVRAERRTVAPLPLEEAEGAEASVPQGPSDGREGAPLRSATAAAEPLSAVAGSLPAAVAHGQDIREGAPGFPLPGSSRHSGSGVGSVGAEGLSHNAAERQVVVVIPPEIRSNNQHA